MRGLLYAALQVQIFTNILGQQLITVAAQREIYTQLIIIRNKYIKI